MYLVKVQILLSVRWFGFRLFVRDGFVACSSSVDIRLRLQGLVPILVVEDPVLHDLLLGDSLGHHHGAILEALGALPLDVSADHVLDI